jgi:arabinogalactan endo-1,4-beta-galactosidase
VLIQQATPAAWDDSSIGQLTWTVYNYTLAVSNAYQAAGIQPSIISIGNEIRAGLLWPLGGTSSYKNIADILHSAAWGIKDSKLSPKPSIMSESYRRLPVDFLYQVPSCYQCRPEKEDTR